MSNPSAHMRWRRWAPAALCAGLLAGCASQADLLQLKQEQRETRALVADQQVALEGLRRRVDILRGELNESNRSRRSTAGSPDATDRIREFEARLSAVEQGRPAAPPPVAAIPPPTTFGTGEPPMAATAPEPPVAAPPPPRPQTALEASLARDEAAAQNAPAEYRDGIALVRQGQCNQAVPKLRDFIRKNAKSDVADNAQYLIGQCYYTQRDYNRAIIELNEVVLKYPKADRVPGALLLLAESFADSGDKIDARLILQKLVSEHPKTEEAERAKQKLQSLGA